MNKAITDILGVSCIVFRISQSIMELQEIEESEYEFKYLIIYVCIMLLFWFSSALTCLTVCVDRFLAVVFPLSKFNGNMKKTKLVIALIWCASILFTIPITYIEFAHKGEKARLARTISFVIFFHFPLLVMFVLYSVISYKLWMRMPPGQQKTSQKPNLFLQRFGLKSRETPTAAGLDCEGVATVSYHEREDHFFKGHHRNGKITPIESSPPTEMRSIAVEISKGDAGDKATNAESKEKSTTQRSCSEISKRRVTKMMFFLVLANAVCWLPFSLVFVIKPWISGFKMIPGCYVCDSLLIDLASMDALVNPLLYFIMNVHFQKALRRLLFK